jgi:hypothetical protein
MHTESHPLAGQTVKIKDGTQDPTQSCVVGGAEYRIEDWWDTLTGKSWMLSDGNWAAMHYALRSALVEPMLPIDDEVVYGKIGAFGHIVHVSELDL